MASKIHNVIFLFGLVIMGDMPVVLGISCYYYSYSYYYGYQQLKSKYCYYSCCGTTSYRYCCSSYYYYTNYYGSYYYDTADVLSAGAIAGIVIGSLSGLFLLFTICGCVIKACTKSGQTGRTIQPTAGIAVVSNTTAASQFNYPYNNGMSTAYGPQGLPIYHTAAAQGPSNIPGQIPLNDVTTKQ